MKKIIWIVAIMLSTTILSAQNAITSMEYWFDNGFSSRQEQIVTTSTELNLAEQITLPILPVGLHAIHFRFKNENNKWGSVCSRFFTLPADAASSEIQPISRLEYWFDKDYTSAISREISPTNQFLLNEMIDITALRIGLHSLHYRFRDKVGKWSPVASKFIVRPQIPEYFSDNQVTAYRYWFDDDTENMTTISVNTPIENYILDASLDHNSLSSGTHFLNIQFLDKTKKWSSVTGDTFTVEPNPNAVLSSSVNQSCVNTSITFSAITTDVDNIEWNFGDGTTSTDFSPTHAYSIAGEYFVSATVSNTTTGKSKTVNLTTSIAVHQTFNETSEISVCAGELPYAFGTQSLTQAGEYVETFQSVNGCDSIVTLTLHISSAYNVMYSDESSSTAYLINDNFEDEVVGSKPANWVKLYNGTGDANQIVVNSIAKNSLNSFQLEGQSGWASEYYQSIPGSPGKLTIEAWINVEKTLSGLTGGIGLADKSVGSWGTRTSRLEFYNGRIRATYTGGAFYDIQSYTPGVWYHIRMEHDLGAKTYSVFINDVKVSGTLGSEITDVFPMHQTVSSKEVVLLAGNSGTVKLFFDNVKMYEPSVVEVCASELPFIFGTQSITESGQYQEIFKTKAGCDSIVTLNLVVKPVFNETKSVTICDSELPYLFGGQSLTLAGTYTETFTSKAGCDSIVALTLKVNPVFNERETVMICESELPYAFGSQSLTESGVYTDRYTSVNGCDSIRTLALTVNPVYNETSEKTVYLNELPFHFGIQELSESGTYTETFQSISGCDSIVTLTLTVLDIKDVTPVAVGSPINIYLNSNGSYIITPMDIYNLTKETTDENYDYGDLTFSVTPNFFNCSDAESTKTVRIIATNPLNNRDTCYTQVSIFDDTLPSILCKDVIVELNELNQVSIQLDDIIVSQYDACQIANISLSQTDFGCQDIGINQVIITVSDHHGNVNTCNSKVTVVSKNSRPTVDPIPDQTVDEDSELITIPLTGIGYGSDCQKQAISISASATKSSLISEINTIYTDGEVDGTLEIKVSPDAFGITDVKLIVTDSEGGTFTQTFSLSITPVNDAPIVLTDLEDIRIDTMDTLSVYISSERGVWFDDPDPDDVHQIQVKSLSGEALPDWIIFRNDSLIVTPLKSDVGCIDILVRASDNGGLFTTNTFKVCAGFPVSSRKMEEQIRFVRVFPNPTSGLAYLSVPVGLRENYTVVLSDNTGRQMISKQYSDTEHCSIDLSFLSNGVYILNVYSGKLKFRQKVILRK